MTAVVVVTVAVAVAVAMALVTAVARIVLLARARFTVVAPKPPLEMASCPSAQGVSFTHV